MTESTTTRNQRQTVIGEVTSNKMDKTIKIRIQRQVKHPVYEKRIHRRTTCTAHDEKNEANVGDMVEITSTRKRSKSKCWRLVKILKRAE
jgi:small subunit ribosomal protein S17